MMDVFDLADDRYAAQVAPELYNERQPVLANWSEEDREMYCGIYTSARRSEIQGASRFTIPESGYYQVSVKFGPDEPHTSFVKLTDYQVRASGFEPKVV